MKVEIFKTSVCRASEAEAVIKVLLKRFPQYRINFDLEDCDRILRIETRHDDVDQKRIGRLLAQLGYECCGL